MEISWVSGFKGLHFPSKWGVMAKNGQKWPKVAIFCPNSKKKFSNPKRGWSQNSVDVKKISVGQKMAELLKNSVFGATRKFFANFEKYAKMD